nr:MAG TPA: Thioredoxin [Caudoviricetes sp.]
MGTSCVVVRSWLCDYYTSHCGPCQHFLSHFLQIILTMWGLCAIIKSC